MGFDVGQSMGWSVFRGRRLTAHGIICLDPRQPLKSISKIRGILAEWCPSDVAVEAVGFCRYTSAHASYSRLRALLDLAIDERGLPAARDVTPSELKKWATGSGRAEKADMIRAVYRRFGARLDDDASTAAAQKRAADKADAILVGAWMIETCIDE